MTAYAALTYIAERSDLLFFVFDVSEQQFTYGNPAFRSFFNIDTPAIPPSMLWAMLHPAHLEDVKTQLNACLNGQPVPPVECRIMRNKFEHWLRITPFLNTENGQRIITGYAEEITDYKAQNRAIQQHSGKRDPALSILSHDLAGPIGNIQALSELLSRDIEPLKDPKLNEYVSMIRRISKNSVRIIRDFLSQKFSESH